MTVKINKFGELDINQNHIVYFSPITNFNRRDIDKEILRESYVEFLEKINYSDFLAHINNFSEKGKYINFEYDEHETATFLNIRSLDFYEQLHYFRSLIEIGKLQEKYKFQVLWSVENFLLSYQENDKKLRALLYEFSNDVKIYDNTTALNGVKSIILSALTKLNNVIGKPTKADFISKSEEVYKFAEDVLYAHDISIIEENIIDLIDIHEQKLEEERIKSEEAKARKKTLFKKKKESPKNNTIKKPKDKIKKDLQNQYSGTNKNKEKKPFFKRIREQMFNGTKNTVITIIVIAVLFFGAMALPSMVNGGSSEKEKEQQAKENKINKEIANIYREHVNGNEKKAHEKMFAIKYDNIPQKEDKKIYIDWLVQEEKYTKALDLSKRAEYKIGKNISDKNVTELKKINNDDKYKVLSFFIAKQDKDFQTMIEMQNDVDLKDQTIANDLVKSYLLTNQESELEKFMDKIKKDKEVTSKEYKNLNAAKQSYQEKTTQLENADKDKDKAQQQVEKLDKKSDKSKKEKEELKKSRKDLEKAEDDYNKQFEKILETPESEAIPKES